MLVCNINLFFCACLAKVTRLTGISRVTFEVHGTFLHKELVTAIHALATQATDKCKCISSTVGCLYDDMLLYMQNHRQLDKHSTRITLSEVKRSALKIKNKFLKRTLNIINTQVTYRKLSVCVKNIYFAI